MDESVIKMLENHIDQLTQDIHYLRNEVSIEVLKAARKVRQEKLAELQNVKK